VEKLIWLSVIARDESEAAIQVEEFYSAVDDP
jgi:hypothetical protein